MENIQYVTKRSATCSDLLSCLYNLKSTDLEVLLQVAKKENATTEQIAAAVHRDRTSIHRCLSKLVSAGLVHRQSRSIQGGGYYHVYTMTEPDKIKQDAKRKVKEIAESLDRLIGSFESDFRKHLESL